MNSATEFFAEKGLILNAKDRRNSTVESQLAQKVANSFEKSQAVSPYMKIGADIGRLVTDKQAAYGDMIRGAQDIVKLLYPGGIQPDQYSDALLVLRVLDKIGRITRGNKTAFGESPWRDICGYAILGAEQDERRAGADGRNPNK